jgi:hypothetical protein
MSIRPPRLIAFSMLFLGILALTPARVGAQVFDTIRFTAPFSFIAGKVELPSGTYTISPVGISASAIFIRSFEHGVLVSVDPVDRPMSPAITAQSGEQLVFKLREGKCVLSQIWENGNRDGEQVAGTYPVQPSKSAGIPSAEDVTVLIPAQLSR